MIFNNLADLCEQGYAIPLYDIRQDKAIIRHKGGDIDIPIELYNRLNKRYATVGDSEGIPFLSMQAVNEALAHG